MAKTSKVTVKNNKQEAALAQVKKQLQAVTESIKDDKAHLKSELAKVTQEMKKQIQEALEKGYAKGQKDGLKIHQDTIKAVDSALKKFSAPTKAKPKKKTTQTKAKVSKPIKTAQIKAKASKPTKTATPSIDKQEANNDIIVDSSLLNSVNQEAMLNEQVVEQVGVHLDATESTSTNYIVISVKKPGISRVFLCNITVDEQ